MTPGAADGTGGRLVRLHTRQPIADDGFAAWLADEGVSVVFAGGSRLWVASLTADGQVEITDRVFDGSIKAILAAGDDPVVVTWQVWSFTDARDRQGPTPEGFDRFYLPQMGVTIGEVGITDALVLDGALALVSTTLGCVAGLDPRFGLRPVWIPTWDSATPGPDGTRLTGAAPTPDGGLAVSCWAAPGGPPAWREAGPAGGAVVDEAGTVILDRLSMPGALRRLGDRLLLAHCGAGELLCFEPGAPAADVVARTGAVPTALAVHGQFALVGLTGAAGTDFEGRPGLEATGPDRVVILDVATGRQRGALHLQGRTEGLTSVAVLAGSRRPHLAIPRGTTARTMVSVAPPTPL